MSKSPKKSARKIPKQEAEPAKESTSTTTTAMEEEDEYEEKIMVLQLNGVLDFDTIKRAAQKGAICIRNAGGTEDMPQQLIQVGSSLYSAEWVKTLGADLLFCVNKEENSSSGTAGTDRTTTADSTHTHLPMATEATTANRLKGCAELTDAAEKKTPNLELVALSDVQLRAKKVLLTK